MYITVVFCAIESHRQQNEDVNDILRCIHLSILLRQHLGTENIYACKPEIGITKRIIHEKGWGDVVSAVCVQMDRQIVYIVPLYTLSMVIGYSVITQSIYICKCNKQLRRHLPNPFCELPCTKKNMKQHFYGTPVIDE